MTIDPCVVVVKRAVLDRGGRAAHLARAGHLTARRLLGAAAEQRLTLAAVLGALKRRRLSPSIVHADAIDAAARRRIRRARLVITVGGDGTLLTAAHHIADGAALAVNSAPGDSVGHFCLTDRGGFEARLREVESGALRPWGLFRLHAVLDGRPLREPALNDVLIAHDHPAATSRYRIAAAGREEEHRSSGLWIATAAGSTAGIRSAGGRPMKVRSRRFQFRARELYRETGRTYRLAAGFVNPGETLTIDSKMEKGFLFIDGARSAYPFPFGSRLQVRVSEAPLRLFARLRS